MSKPPRSILSETPGSPSKYGRQNTDNDSEDTNDEVNGAVC